MASRGLWVKVNDEDAAPRLFSGDRERDGEGRFSSAAFLGQQCERFHVAL